MLMGSAFPRAFVPLLAAGLDAARLDGVPR